MRVRVTTALVGVLAAVLVGHAAAPSAPQNLTAVVNGTTVTLRWDAPSTGDVPTGYVILASLSPNGPAIAALPVSGTSLVVPNVPSGVYYVHVRAVNVDGISGPSNEIIVVAPGGTAGCPVPPAAPSNLSATASGTLVNLAWTASSGVCPATGYVVQAGSLPQASDIAVINVGSATVLSANAPPGTYYVRVVALNAAGGSAPSNEIVVTVAASGGGPAVIAFGGLAGAPNRSAITTYTEAGYTLTATAQNWMALTSYGNPAPFIQFVRDASQPTQVGEVNVNAGGAVFTFTSVDVYSSTTPIPYEFVGLRNGVAMFTHSAVVPNTFGGFATVSNPSATTLIDTLLIRLTNPATGLTNPVGFDNLRVSR
jgi:hypothetical protein